MLFNIAISWQENLFLPALYREGGSPVEIPAAILFG
jgi:hypothetical protein